MEDEELERRINRELLIAAALCGCGTIWGVVKVAGVNFTLYPHHWPF